MTEESNNKIEEFGQFIKKSRQEQKIEIYDICRKLNIKEKNIIDLEEGNWRSFDKKLYVVGLIKSYSKLLRIDEKIIDQRMSTLSFDSNTTNKTHQLVNIGEHRDLSPDKKTFVNFVILSSILFAIFLLILGNNLSKSNLITNQEIIEKINNANENF